MQSKAESTQPAQPAQRQHPGYASAVRDESRSHDDSTGRPELDLAIEWQRLLQKCVALEPNGGYQTERQIPALSSLDIAAVLAHDPDVLIGVAASAALQASIAATLAGKHNVIDQAALVGVAVISALTVDCRQYLLDAVLEEIARDEEAKAADESDARAACATSAAARMEWAL